MDITKHGKYMPNSEARIRQFLMSVPEILPKILKMYSLFVHFYVKCV
jgi:hypothetical protein